MNLMSFLILPFLRSARYIVSMPDAVAAAFSKALCIQGTCHAVYGNRQVETSRQPVAFAITTGSSQASSTCRTTVGAPQPEHMRCPPHRLSFLCVRDFRVNGFSSVGALMGISLLLASQRHVILHHPDLAGLRHFRRLFDHTVHIK